jgi:hypothetical protein
MALAAAQFAFHCLTPPGVLKVDFLFPAAMLTLDRSFAQFLCVKISTHFINKMHVSTMRAGHVSGQHFHLQITSIQNPDTTVKTRKRYIFFYSFLCIYKSIYCDPKINSSQVFWQVLILLLRSGLSFYTRARYWVKKKRTRFEKCVDVILRIFSSKMDSRPVCDMLAVLSHVWRWKLLWGVYVVLAFLLWKEAPKFWKTAVLSHIERVWHF